MYTLATDFSGNFYTFYMDLTKIVTANLSSNSAVFPIAYILQDMLFECQINDDDII